MKTKVPSVEEHKLTLEEFNQTWDYIFNDAPKPKYLSRKEYQQILNNKVNEQVESVKLTGSMCLE